MSEFHTVKTTPEAFQVGKDAGWCSGLSKDPIEEGGIVRVITGERISLAIVESVQQRGKLNKVLLDCWSEEKLTTLVRERIAKMPYFTGPDFRLDNIH